MKWLWVKRERLEAAEHDVARLEGYVALLQERERASIRERDHLLDQVKQLHEMHAKTLEAMPDHSKQIALMTQILNGVHEANNRLEVRAQHGATLAANDKRIEDHFTKLNRWLIAVHDEITSKPRVVKPKPKRRRK